MGTYTIALSGNITSKVFYDIILNELHMYFLEKINLQKRLVFDFSEVNSIDSLVIPNLLCIGYAIKNATAYPPIFFIPQSQHHGKIKRYLIDINFYKIAKKFKLYEFDNYFDCGLEGKKLNKINRTEYFDFSESDQETYAKINYIFKEFKLRYLKPFTNYNIHSDSDNDLVRFCMEIILNCRIHGGSFCFLTMQYNDYLKMMNISISDYGIGFKNSLIRSGEFTENIDFISEYESIIRGIFKRKDSEIYGLYNVLDKITTRDGVMRIHSMDTQLIITKYLYNNIKKDTLEEIIKYKNDDKFKNNVKSDLKYKGVHIEIEIPINEQQLGGEIR